MNISPLRLTKTLLAIAALLSTSGFGDDRGLDVHPGPAAHEQYSLDLATNGDTWMAAWMDNRSGMFDICVSPLDERGQPVFPEGIPIATTGLCDHEGLIVEWTGVSYSVVWIAAELMHRAIYAAQLAADGTIVRPPSKIVDLPPDIGIPAMASNGSRLLVAWPSTQEPDLICDVDAILFDANLAVVSPPLRLSTRPLHQSSVGVAAAEGRFLVTLSDRTGATSFQTSTAVVTNDGIVLPGGSIQDTSGGSMAWNGSEWAMTWGGSDGHALFTTINSVGLPSGKITILPPEWISGPDAEWDGSNFLIAFSAYQGPLFTLRVSSNGDVVDLEPVQITDTKLATVSDMARNAHGMLVGWTDYRTGVNIFDLLLPIAPAAIRSPEQILAKSLEEQQASSVTSDGTIGLLVWSELVDSSTPVLRATRLNAAGVQLDNPPLELHRGDTITSTAIAVSSDGFLVVWTAAISNTINAAAVRVRRDGTLAGARLNIATSVRGIAAASDGHQFLLVWSDNRGIVGEALSWDTTESSPFAIATPSEPNTSLWMPDVVFNGSGFVVSWLSSTSCGRTCYFQDAYVASIAGAAVDHITKIAPARGPARLASNGEHTAVVWPSGNVSIAILNRNLEPVTRASAGDQMSQASDVDVIWTGERWVAAWTAFDSDEWPECVHDSRSHIESASFAADLHEFAPAHITAPDDSSHSPSLAKTGLGVFVVYERFVPPAPALHRGGISRVFLRAIGVPRQRATVR